MERKEGGGGAAGSRSIASLSCRRRMRSDCSRECGSRRTTRLSSFDRALLQLCLQRSSWRSRLGTLSSSCSRGGIAASLRHDRSTHITHGSGARRTSEIRAHSAENGLISACRITHLSKTAFSLYTQSLLKTVFCQVRRSHSGKDIRRQQETLPQPCSLYPPVASPPQSLCALRCSARASA